MKNKLAIAFCLITINGCSQINSEILNYLNKKSSLGFNYIIFFEPELIEYCNDSLHRSKIIKEVSRQKKWIHGGNEESVQERKIFLSMLYQRIKNTKVLTTTQNQSKKFLLDLLSEFKVDFPVDEKLLEARFNPKKRGLPFGDEECDVDFSFYVFFLYDPELYLKVLKSNKVANPSGKIIFPTTCFLEELSHLPLVMKKRTQDNLLMILDKYKGPDYEILRNKIKNANLNAKFD